MPVLVIYGMPDSISQLELVKLIDDLRFVIKTELCSALSNVSIFFPVDLVKQGLGEELICFVEGLFGKIPNRASQKLAEKIMVELSLFAEKSLPQCQRVEVMVKRFIRDNDGFAFCDLRE